MARATATAGAAADGPAAAAMATGVNAVSVAGADVAIAVGEVSSEAPVLRAGVLSWPMRDLRIFFGEGKPDMMFTSRHRII
jgi:hypothetical protein